MLNITVLAMEAGNKTPMEPPADAASLVNQNANVEIPGGRPYYSILEIKSFLLGIHLAFLS